jgi:hypothetical protein
MNATLKVAARPAANARSRISAATAAFLRRPGK